MFPHFPSGDNLKYFKVVQFTPLDELDWTTISADPSKIVFIKAHLDRVDWYALETNPHPAVAELLKKRPV
jgi:hypothetical protein